MAEETYPPPPEAATVMHNAEQLYRCVYKNLGKIRWLDYKIGLWDIGWWQVWSAAKDMAEATEPVTSFKDSMGKLGDEIRSHLSEYGFTPPTITPLE